MKEEPHFFLDNTPFTPDAPAYYDKSDFDWIPYIEENWQIIKNEMITGLNPDNIPAPQNNPNLVENATVWRNLCFINYLWQKKKIITKYPQTWELLKKIPNLSYAALNLLEPHSKIKKHQGDTNITARCHLGLVIPAGLPECGIEVNGQQTGWQEGKIFAFSDAHWHHVWNNTNQQRYVFVIDVIMPQYAEHKKIYCAKILGALSLKTFKYKMRLTMDLPNFILTPLHFLVSAGWLVYLRIQNKP
jgi:aspartyl/asparaginyl beta-hydroxylase (cupin superfamily)